MPLDRTPQTPEESGRKGLSRRIFIQSAAAAGITWAGLAGCGNSGYDALSGSAAGAGGINAALPDVQVPVLTPVARLESEVLAGVDAGTRYTVQMTASQGGQFTLPDGTKILFPPGALPADTEISVLVPTAQATGDNLRRFLFSPSGLVFNTPVFLFLPLLPLQPGDFVMSFDSSPVTPLEDLGSELTNWKLTVPVAEQGSMLVLALAHFTYIFGAKALDLGMYLVTDIPAKNLEIGDVMFFLTSQLGSPQWRPGHVAMLIKDGMDNQVQHNKPDRLVESGGGGGGVAIDLLSLVRYTDSHIYLGPRRHPDALTKPEQTSLKQFLFSKLGTPYAVIGDQGDDVIPITSGFSCVGICDAALRNIGKGLANWYIRQYVMTPLEYYFLTTPVTEITVTAGELFEMPVYGVVVDPNSFLPGDVLGLLSGSYSRGVPYDIAPLRFPANSTFVQQDVVGGPGYLFSWTPTRAQVNQTFELELLLVAERQTWNLSTLLRDESKRTLHFKVIPQGDYEVIYHIPPVHEPYAASFYEYDDIAIDGTSGKFLFQRTLHDTTGSASGPPLVTLQNGDQLTDLSTQAYVDLNHSVTSVWLNQHNDVAWMDYLGPEIYAQTNKYKKAGQATEAYDGGPARMWSLTNRDGDGDPRVFGVDSTLQDGFVVIPGRPGQPAAPLGLRALSGFEFGYVLRMQANDSGQVLVVVGRVGGTLPGSALLLYKSPTLDQPIATCTVLEPFAGPRMHQNVAINNRGDYAYTDGLNLVIRRVGRPEVSIDGIAHPEHRILDERLRLNQAGDLFALKFGVGQSEILKFPNDGGEPIPLSPFFPTNNVAISTFDASGPLVAVTRGTELFILRQREVLGPPTI